MGIWALSGVSTNKCFHIHPWIHISALWQNFFRWLSRNVVFNLEHTFFWCFWMVALSIIPHVRYFLDVHAWICQRRLPSAVCPTSKRERSRSLHAAEFQTPVLNSTPKNILYFTTETILPAYSHKVNWGLIFEKYSLISTEELTPGEGWSSHPQKRSGRAGSPVRDATVKIWESWKRRNKFQILFFWTY